MRRCLCCSAEIFDNLPYVIAPDGGWYHVNCYVDTYLKDKLLSVPELTQLLKQRGERYGSFEDNADFVDRWRDLFAASRSYVAFSASMKYAVMMIGAKFSRIATGDPTHIDSWDDVAGYATKIADELRQKAQT